MPTLSITKTYLNGNVLYESDLDNLRNSITTFFNTTLLDSTNVQTAGLIGANFANATISSAQFAPSCVGVAQLSSSAITSASLSAACILTQNFQLGAVGNSQIGAKNASTSQSCGLFRMANNNTYQRITNLSTTITTTVGRPIWMGVIPDGTGGNGFTQDVLVSVNGSIRFTRNGSQIATLQGAAGAAGFDFGILQHIDNPGPGTWTYAVDALENPAFLTTSSANYVVLAIYEL